MYFKTLLLSFCSSIVFAQNIIGIDPLMAKEKIISKTQLVCNEKGENCVPQIEFIYDEIGRLISKKSFSGDTLVETNRYEYNQANQAEKVYTSYGNGREFLNVKYTYNAKNQLINYESCHGIGKCDPFEKYTYKTDGKLDTRIRFKDGKYFYEYKHKYDSRGNNTEILILSKDSDSGERELKKYNAKNQHISTRWIDYRGEDIDAAEFTYDEKGRLLKNEWIGGLSTQKLYTYDELGNNLEYKSIDYNKQIDDHRIMTYSGELIESRIRYADQKFDSYTKFIYKKSE